MHPSGWLRSSPLSAGAVSYFRLGWGGCVVDGTFLCPGSDDRDETQGLGVRTFSPSWQLLMRIADLGLEVEMGSMRHGKTSDGVPVKITLNYAVFAERSEC
jgi:hypothetical protein